MDSKNYSSNTIQNLSNLTASCRCASVSLPIHLLIEFLEQNFPIETPLCHCSICRHSTGLLCTSYIPIVTPPISVLENTIAFPGQASSHAGIQRYFCPNCGCHVFRSKLPAEDPGRGNTADYEQIEERRMWEVATGVLNNVPGVVRISRHENVRDTVDGGLSIFISERKLHYLPDSLDETRPDCQYCEPKDGYGSVAVAGSTPNAVYQSSQEVTDRDVLQGHCACHAVKFHISRPNLSSLLPHSPFPDLMIPYYTRDPQIPNPRDEKWWLRSPAGTSASTSATAEREKIGGAEAADTGEKSIITPSTSPSLKGVKYLAGTCACRSCRLTSGFEIQTWTFIPRSNIYFHLPNIPDETSLSSSISSSPPTSSPTAISIPAKTGITPLDFPSLRAHKTSVLKTYESSPEVEREFCATCGATVFWHDKRRPDIVDVSVGLLDAPEGARAETWLEWWDGRVSFAEDARRGPEGTGNGGKEGGEGKAGGEGKREAGWDWDLIPALERGLRRWKETRGSGES